MTAKNILSLLLGALFLCGVSCVFATTWELDILNDPSQLPTRAVFAQISIPLAQPILFLGIGMTDGRFNNFDWTFTWTDGANFTAVADNFRVGNVGLVCHYNGTMSPALFSDSLVISLTTKGSITCNQPAYASMQFTGIVHLN
eukprot:ANDGO_07433.mRNA.1 hypothetical protein